jgi:hypothetical protein
MRSLEIVIGRTAAICVHPVAAWHSRSRYRWVLLAGYAAAGYAVTFATLSLNGM